MTSHRTYRVKSEGFTPFEIARPKGPSGVQARARFQTGFTLVEILLVIGIFMVIATMTIMIGMNSIGRGVVMEDRDLLVILLNDARANALANINESRHGVHIAADGSKYTVFEGDDFATSDVSTHRDVKRVLNVTISPLDGEVVFDRLSGDAYAGAGTITLSRDALSVNIDMNSNGRIDW